MVELRRARLSRTWETREIFFSHLGAGDIYYIFVLHILLLAIFAISHS